MSDELRALTRSSNAELDSWLSQEIQDELGTLAYILRAIAWCQRGALARARADVDAALSKLPAYEIVELTGAMVLFVTHDYERARALLDGVARRHRYIAAQTLRVLVAMLARLGWTAEQHGAQQQLAALGVRDLRAHVLGLQQRRGAGDASLDEPDHATTELFRMLADEGPPTREDFLELDALATGLLSDAARELGVTLWLDGGLLDDPSTLARVRTHARGMIIADRPTPISYRTRTGDTTVLRHLPPSTIARAAHDEDAADLDRAAKLLVRAIEKRRGSAHRATATRSLDADQIESFLADGYVHLRGAFPRELAASVVASAHRRLRENLAHYDPDDPSTWPEGRLDIEGERRFTIREFSAFAERAVFQLLGDAARIRTRSWTSNLIAQYPVRSLDSWIPAPDHQSWHLDSPSTHTRIDELRTGLLVFIVFSDLHPNSGNSWLALDSPAKVARKLARAPEGLDFCTDTAGCSITRTCERFFELTGEAGDLFLVHPLMLHSASLNPSPRIRFLGNPMVYMQEPLDPRAETSPVERLIARAIA